MKYKYYTFILFILAQFVTNAYATTDMPYTIQDTLAFNRIGQVIASPDGNEVLYSTLRVNLTNDTKKWEYSLYLKDQNGNLTLVDKNDKSTFQSSWLSDGKQFAYLAPGTKYESIWVQNKNDHNKKKLVEYSSDIFAFKWSPDGKKIAFVANDTINIPTVSHTIDVDKNYINTRLYIISVEGGTAEIAEPITSAKISVSKGFDGFDWSPDSKSIVFSYQPRPGFNYHNESKISIINLATRNIINIPYTNNHAGIQPFYSPDGQWIAFNSNFDTSSHAKKLNENLYVNSRVCVIQTSLLKTRCLSNTFNGNPSILGWNYTSNEIFVTDVYKTLGPRIYALSIQPQKAMKIISDVDGFIDPLTITLNNNHTVFGFRYETDSEVPQAYISNANNFKLTQVSHLQPSTHAPLGKTEVIHWKSTDGTIIEGLLSTPANYNPKMRYPLLVEVHGGPANAWYNHYLGGCDEYLDMIVPTSCFGHLLSKGFIIFQPNPRGSTGYGKEFRMANFADFGGGDYKDIVSGINDLIQKGIAHPDHLAIAGWSYGGYLTAWAVTQTNRFKAAIDGDGRTDMISYANTADIRWLLPDYLGHHFWENNSLYLQRSPITYVKNIKTPLLILHGQNDVRVPVTQAYELYYALKEQNKPVKMLLSPQTGHAPNDANIIYESIKYVDEWLEQALK